MSTELKGTESINGQVMPATLTIGLRSKNND